MPSATVICSSLEVYCKSYFFFNSFQVGETISFSARVHLVQQVLVLFRIAYPNSSSGMPNLPNDCDGFLLHRILGRRIIHGGCHDATFTTSPRQERGVIVDEEKFFLSF